jgi:mannose-6-phosphate isomerase class I
VFSRPVEEFELIIEAASQIPRSVAVGPLVVLCLDGHGKVRCETDGDAVLLPGQAVFVGADDGATAIESVDDAQVGELLPIDTGLASELRGP